MRRVAASSLRGGGGGGVPPIANCRTRCLNLFALRLSPESQHLAVSYRVSTQKAVTRRGPVPHIGLPL